MERSGDRRPEPGRRRCPDQDIVVVHRSDGSGTTYIFTDYLSHVSPEWKAKVGKNTSVNWPAGLGGKGNAGVAGQIKQSPGAIGYVELAYAKQNNLPYADMKNAAGNYITPSIESSSRRWPRRTIPDDFRFSMVNPPGDEGLPDRRRHLAAGLRSSKRITPRARSWSQFLKWAYTDGEKMAAAPRLRAAARQRAGSACSNGSTASSTDSVSHLPC